MPTASTRRREHTRTRLMEAALEVFADRGFHGASIENICETAGFTRGAFYSNFAGKDELFFTLFDASSDQLIAALRAALDECRKSPDPISTFISTIDDRGPAQRRWYLISMEFTLYAIREPSAAVVLAEHDARLRHEAAAIINELMTIAHRELIIDAELITRLVVALREGVAAQFYVEPELAETRMLERLAFPAMVRAFSHPVGATAGGA
ncbi:TetR/AcrR family transcriptional regulator [Mycobacteroides salmoniphilum]|uniref:HTH-type transcriptional regulator SrpR n=1 Tax=Mycobacteroides salmoniphilum TaxID=404941 RepID=A0A4R8SPU1_9MYCO|nr:TetR/AcrR family transcriptional regulator [Mycobacteroides salmoniphilum]TDZ91068.1 HTH-type transcriptional regulator SrpR [Mycobacteroides salmoniphilum]TEA01014.1 HTH-type transcriptional regulator SrpR [Mycobacteroides salmoniphilum]